MLAKIDSEFVKQKIIDFIKEIYNKTGTDGFIIGLSGGIDSTVVAYLLKEAVDNDKVYSYHLFSSTTPKEDTEHARLIANLFDLHYDEISIDNLTDEFLNLSLNSSNPDFNSSLNSNLSSKLSSNFNSHFKSNEDIGINLSENKTAEGNVKARIRMIILYYFANLRNCLVAGTGNRSELLIGYFTKHGDGACDFEPIGDIYKTQLKKLAKDWNIPDEIINKPPRAGLWTNQTDEDEIGLSYEVLDELLYLIVDKKLNNEDILDISEKMKINSSEIDNIRKKIANNQHKLQCPPTPFEDKKLF
ncbi:putative NH(3)-dependent NAD(+) synthetase [Candidatus Methanobinarius endosymbioticus]|uniref:NH(3)-dependent NAD(+) synthetase n=1 Tax=Candidatus Methanobinarius endosymbioticus TaxID=2006182 RepID=A0A366MBN5_9EURY|nr:putative NH(3)-dependent NAD(+) synthetase [Candidatus Methanobinarius endosymbioticus]